MRTLTCTEIEFTHGANGAAILTGLLLTTLATTALLTSFSSSSCNGTWKKEPYIKEVRTPIYDAYGKHIANNVDSYQDFRWVCVS